MGNRSKRWLGWLCVSGLGIGVPCLPALATGGEKAAPVALRWLDGSAPAVGQGVSWGVPWPQGRLQARDAIALKTADGRDVPFQTWPLAYWPDGSLKWTGHAVSADSSLGASLTLSIGRASATAARLTVTQEAAGIDVDTGVLRCRIARRGTQLFASLSVAGRTVAQNARLIARREDRSELASRGIVRAEEFVGEIQTVTLEQSGPVRAVVKVEGVHRGTQGERTWLPFVVRLYFFAGQDSVRLVHSFVFDGDPEQDFVRGLGLAVSVPLREEMHNRHVRLGGDTGMWAEPIQPLVGRRVVTLPSGGEAFPPQVAGRRLPNLADFAERDQAYLRAAADWDSYRLTQLTPNGFAIEKRTGPAVAWVRAGDGQRAQGVAFLGDVSGGLAVGVKDFWRKYPSAFEVHGATTGEGELRAWLWAPQGEAMDLRHYDTEGHGLEFAYEDIKAGWSSAHGVANTAELTLRALAEVPSNAELVSMAAAVAAPSRLVCAPEYYRAVPVFGRWSLPDRSTVVRRRIEDQLDGAFEFYRQEVDLRHWYGFWDYGDMMRMYDEGRHQWRYDIGGWAWNNTELMPDLWLWYTFLRSGRADAFRVAEAMTRHTSEVDVHHVGRFAPLGSRHNVRHWGDGAKQPRISHSNLKRCYYYLTTDERVGDLMREQLKAEFTFPEVKRQDPTLWGSGGPGGWRRMALGTDWSAYAANWLAEWERTGERRWRDRIVAGMQTQVDLAAGPGQLLGEGAFDPESGRFVAEERSEATAAGSEMAPANRRTRPTGPTNFDTLFGAPELFFELETLIEHPRFWEAWRKHCATTRGRMAAYAAHATGDAELGRRAWEGLLPPSSDERPSRFAGVPRRIEGPDVPSPVQEVPGRPEVAGDAQRLLNLIEALELAGEYLPAE